MALGKVTDQELNEEAGRFRRWVDRAQRSDDISDQLPRQLFHYTSAASLQGIIRDEEFWFTSIFHLNDPSELGYGIDIAIDALRREKQSRQTHAVSFFCDRAEHVLRHKLGDIFAFYVACLSRAHDDLGQWRAYGDDGRGFAIGLSRDLFLSDGTIPADPRQRFVVAAINYDTVVLRRRQRAAVRRAAQIISNAAARGFQSPTQGQDFFIQISTLLCTRLLWNSLTAKHNAYSNEQEIRLILVGDKKALSPHISTRARGSQIVPFVKCPLPIRTRRRLPVVGIGPSAAQEAEDGLATFLESMRLDNTRCKRSVIPYRSAHDLN